MVKKRIVLGESRLRARRRKRRLITLGGSVFIFLCVLFGLVWLSRASFLHITTIKVSGTSTVDPAAIQTLVQRDLSGNYLQLFSKSNVFLYPKKAITADILSQFSVLKDVSTYTTNLHTISITVVERQPNAEWCGNTVASSTSCSLMDEDGFVYAPTATSTTSYQKYYGSLEGTSSQQFLTPYQFHSLSALVDTLQTTESTTSITSIFVDENSDVSVSFDNGFTLLFALGDDSGSVFQRFLIALRADPFTSHPLSDFEYLDLRFGDKLYYKLKTP